MHVSDMRRYSSSIFIRNVPKSRCHGYQLAEILRYHQFQPLFTIFMTLLEKKIQKIIKGVTENQPKDRVPSNRETMS